MNSRSLEGFEHADLAISGKWIAKEVATRDPRPGSVLEHRLEWSLQANVSFLIALTLRISAELQFGRLEAHAADSKALVSLSFVPYDRAASDEVQISLYQTMGPSGAGIRTSLENEDLKKDPRPHVVGRLGEHGTTTGTWLELAALEGPGELVASVVVVAAADTHVAHDRWRLGAEAALPAELGFLTSGRRAGLQALGGSLGQA